MKFFSGIFHRILERYRRNARRGPFYSEYRIFSDADGFGTFGDRGNEVAIRWNEVREITLFQVDCYAIDQIRMEVEMEDGRFFGDLNEDMKGWKELTATLPNVLPGCLTVEEWFPKVCRTAFEPNPTTIFRRTTRRSAEVVGTGRD